MRSTIITISISPWNSNEYEYNHLMSKTLLYHDTFLMRGGAERLNIEIAKILGADIATALWSPDCYDIHTMWFEWKVIEVNPDFKRWIIGFLIMKWRFFRSKNLLKNYDTIIFSNEAISGIWGVKPGTRTYYYAHSISRHLFDQSDQYLAKVPFIIRPFFLIFSLFLKWLYKNEISKIDTIFVNSEINKKRMSEWLDRDDAIILYPSVDTDKFNIFDEKSISKILTIESIPFWNKDYYISFSRLTHAKRIDAIIRAFGKLPDKNLIILYGENDSQKDEFIELGNWFSNIVFHKLRNNDNLPSIINGALASICISKNEDFGMVAIESMACWVPVIAVNEWWYKETLIEGKTWYLLDTDMLDQSLIECVENISINTLIGMQNNCRKQSEKFSLKNMNTQIQEYIR